MKERKDGWEKGWMDGRCKDIRARMNDGVILYKGWLYIRDGHI